MNVLAAFFTLLVACGSFQYAVATCSAHSQASLKTVLAEDSSLCDQCKKYLGSIKEGLLSDRFKKAFYDIGHFVCMWESESSQCKAIVDKSYEFITERVKQVDVQNVCQMLHLCTAPGFCKGPAAFTSCEGCVDSVQKAVDVLQWKMASQMLNTMLKEGCSSISDKEFQKKCTQFFEGPFAKEFPKAAKALIPESTCQLIGYCEANAVDPMPMFHENVGLCKTCTEVIGEVQSLLKSEAFVKRSQEIIKFVCSLTLVYADQCTSLMEEYMKKMVDMVEKTPSNEVCQKIGFCPSPKKY